MSKKKNTLKDLDEFLKQQAASLVSPEKLPSTQSPPTTEPSEPSIQPPHERSTIQQFVKLMQADDERLISICDVVLGTYENLRDITPEEKMLVNTALYIKNPKSWKEVITAYWRNRK
ncbi:MAG TPA: hypothetical protein VD927_13290 [Chryseosolibacter sp.]|nr:hypothetical protein [Chryseosolibacter sp.]